MMMAENIGRRDECGEQKFQIRKLKSDKMEDV